MAMEAADGEAEVGGGHDLLLFDELDAGIPPALRPDEAHRARRVVEGAGDGELALVEALARIVAGGVVVERGDGGDGEIEALAAPAPVDRAGDTDRAARQRLVDLERRFRNEPQRPGVVRRGVGEAA